MDKKNQIIKEKLILNMKLIVTFMLSVCEDYVMKLSIAEKTD
jgi:hypothetical protein